MPAKKDQKESIFQLCGDEYTVLESPHGFYSSKRMKLRHNLCGTEYDVQIKEFLSGKRCPNKICVKNKTKQTCIDKYGVECSLHNKEISNKTKNTLLLKYGVENVFANKQIQERIKQTNVQKYGVEYTIQNEEIKQKTKQTMLQKYGVENLSQSNQIIERIKQTNLQKYGVEYPLQSSGVREKVKQTNFQKYGVEYPLYNEEVREKIKQTRIQQFYNNLQDKFPLLEPCFSQGEYTGVYHRKYRFRCKECGYEFERAIHCREPICRKCKPVFGGRSKQEADVCEFISLILQDNPTSNTREIIPPQELDIYSEQHRVGVEFNGLYWHSEEFVDKKYHFEKSKLAREAGIKLFHIFSDEWEQKQDIVKSMLSHSFGVTQRKLFARKCSIAEVSTRDAKRFFESTHISGGGRSKSAFGLFYDGQLVSCLSLGVPIKNKRYSNCIEIVRFANQLNTHVVGGFSKLFAAAKRWSIENGFENILSYADLRFGDGNVYRKNGFEYLGDTDVNYWYTDGLNRYSRQSFRARDGKTERQIAEEASVFKIYGCGHSIFMLNIK